MKHEDMDLQVLTKKEEGKKKEERRKKKRKKKKKTRGINKFSQKQRKRLFTHSDLVPSFLMMATKMNQYPDFPQCRKLHPNADYYQ